MIQADLRRRVGILEALNHAGIAPDELMLIDNLPFRSPTGALRLKNSRRYRDPQRLAVRRENTIAGHLIPRIKCRSCSYPDRCPTLLTSDAEEPQDAQGCRHDPRRKGAVVRCNSADLLTKRVGRQSADLLAPSDCSSFRRWRYLSSAFENLVLQIACATSTCPSRIASYSAATYFCASPLRSV